MKLLIFFLINKYVWGGILWDYANTLFLLKLSHANFHIHQWMSLVEFITAAFSNSDFLLLPLPLLLVSGIILQGGLPFFPFLYVFSYLFILAWAQWQLLYSLVYSPILLFNFLPRWLWPLGALPGWPPHTLDMYSPVMSSLLLSICITVYSKISFTLSALAWNPPLFPRALVPLIRQWYLEATEY